MAVPRGVDAAAVRWLLSTVPSGMLLDDHDLRDDWNTSLSWRRWATAQAVVAGAGEGCLRLVLGVPAPRQPEPRRARRRRCLRPCSDHHRRRRADPVPRPDRLGRRRRRGDDPMELLPRPRRRGPQGTPGRHRRALLAAPRPRRPSHGRRPRVGMGAPSGVGAGAAVHPPRARLHAAVPAAAGHPPPRGVGRGDLQRWCMGAAGQVVRRTAPPVPRPRALGVVRRVVPGARRALHRSRAVPVAPGDRPAAVGRCPLQLHRRGDAARDAASRARRSTSSRCRRSATTSSGPPSSPTGSSGDGARPPPSAASPRRPASPSRTSRGSSTKAHGSPTA